MLSVDIAAKAFGDRTVLSGVRFDVAQGEIVAITGASGSGKSSLLRIVAGLDRTFSGTIRWAAATPRLGVVFQEPRLLPWRSVRDNLLLAGASPDVAASLLDALGLGGDLDVSAARLSLGMARRVALARALAIGMDALLLDEPFASLDAATAKRARDLLRARWSASPCATVLITHDPAEAVSLADRVLQLSGSPARIGAVVAVPAGLRRAESAASVAFADELAAYLRSA